jgi:GT2 family glycosyltransferase/glycosyltransferase involved in cell wall biosynthesis
MQAWSPTTTDQSRLAACFREISEAVDAGRYPVAVRLADSARRFAPQNPTAILIYARALLSAGEQRAALEFLRDRTDPDSLLLRAEAAYRAGLTQEARQCCHALLSCYALDCVPGLAALAGALCRDTGELPGWVGVDSALRLIGEIAAGRVAHIERNEAPVGRIDRRGISGLPVPFSVRIAASGAEPIRVRVEDRDLLGSVLHWPADFGVTGWVVLEDRCLRGEVSATWAPRAPLELIISCHKHERLLKVPATDAAGMERPFLLDVGDLATQAARIEVAVLLADGRALPLTGSPLQTQPPAPTPVGAHRARPSRAVVHLQPKVNVVVPVYSGREETLTCLRSVFAHTSPEVATVTVVDDASPDGELRDALDQLAAEERITLLRNPVNLGFPGAANRGMRVHPQRDVVLLNADTEVYEGWLERLIRVACAAEDVGTVTPLGEAASIVSYPYEAVAPYSSEEGARIDRIARAVNTGKAVNIPVGVGFCLYLRRRCLEEVGELDERSFGKGYGEENDFCLRARQRGWRHLAATDVFVRHHGGRSFGRSRQILTTRNSRVINFRHPGYDRLVADFMASGGLREPRRAIDRQLLLETARQPVLLVSFDLAGGVQRHVEQRESSLRARGHTVLVLRGLAAVPGSRQAVISVPGGPMRDLVYDLPGDLDELRRLLRDLRLIHLELHHLMGLPSAVVAMLTGLGVPYQVFIHDYAWICPRVSLQNAAGVYCGEPALESCEECVRKHGSAFPEPLTVAQLRRQSQDVLAGAGRTVAPTHDVRQRMGRYFADVGIEVVPWESTVVPPRRGARARCGERLRVAVIGAIGTPKGYSILLDCARDAAARGLPMEFVVVGYTRDDLPLRDTGRVFITGPYEEHEALALLERERCDIALFASVSPETWCYSLTYALAAGLPIVAFDLGAIAERLRAAGTGVLVPRSTPPGAINDTLLRVDASTGFLKINTTNAGSVMQANHTTEAGPAATDLNASVQLIRLPVGIYAFTVTEGGAASGSGVVLPALQVAPAPVRSRCTIEFLEGPATVDRWLTRRGDVVTVKVSSEEATLLLTSLRAPDSSVLSIDIRRLDVAEPAPSTQPGTVLHSPVDLSLPTSTLVHVQNLGDLEFSAGWAGGGAQGLWIEAFAARLAQTPGPIEYLGINHEGDETSWVTDGALCGSRGAGIPLVAFAVRPKEAVAGDYTCLYSGRFLSGSEVGPCTDGSLCRSPTQGDPLVAIELRVQRRQPASAG